MAAVVTVLIAAQCLVSPLYWQRVREMSLPARVERDGCRSRADNVALHWTCLQAGLVDTQEAVQKLTLWQRLLLNLRRSGV